MGKARQLARRFFRRLTRTAPGKGPGVPRVRPDDPEYCEYARYLMSPRRMIMSNLVAGMARGVGMALGFSLLGAALVYVLRALALHNLPIIGDFIADIIAAVEASK